MSDSKDLQERAYTALDNFLTQHEYETVEIEVLPDAIEPPDGSILLEDGRCLGIPKKVLVMAYLEAKKIFFANSYRDNAYRHRALKATRIMLLFDPEHITAANFRKKNIISLRERSEKLSEKMKEPNASYIFTEDWKESNADYMRALDRDAVFVNNILTSPLHRQSKSPTLWYHRTWLLPHVLKRTRLGDPTGDRFLKFVSSELDAVCGAGERHPKNYYAWQYARKLISKTRVLYDSGVPYPWKDSYFIMMYNCVLQVKAWCLKHPSDTSGWSFLLFLIPKLWWVSEKQETVEQVLEYAIRLRWEGEALWAFLRTVLSGTKVREEHGSEEQATAIQRLYAYHKELQDKAQDDTDGEHLHESRVTKTIEWIELYKTATPRGAHSLP